jgi:hypothetical protein
MKPRFGMISFRSRRRRDDAGGKFMEARSA